MAAIRRMATFGPPETYVANPVGGSAEPLSGPEMPATADRAATGDPVGPVRRGARTYDVPALRRVVDHFHSLVLDDAALRPFFRADLDDLRSHQAAQVGPVLGSPGCRGAAGMPGRYLPLVVPVEFYHRAAFYLVRAVDQEYAGRTAVTAVAGALAARTCLIVGGYPVTGVLVSPALVSVEGAW